MTCDYGRTYGNEAADQIDGHGQWLSIREDALLPLVEQFFAERIFGPMRLDKLARQLRAHQKATAKAANGTQQRAARRDRRPRPTASACRSRRSNRASSPQLVGQRIAEAPESQGSRRNRAPGPHPRLGRL